MTKAAFIQRLMLTVVLCVVPTLCLGQEDAIAEAVPEATASGSPDNAKPTVRPITVSVSLVDDSTIITGTLTETTSINIKTA